MPRRSRRSRRPRATPEGFKWQGNKLVPLEGTTFNEETQEWEVGQPIKEEPSKDKDQQWHWIDDDRIPSQAEIDYYASLDAGEDPEMTQEHLDETGVGEGGEGMTTEDVGSGDDDSGDFDPGSEVNTFTKDEDGNTVVTTDTYGISGDESTMTTTTETVSEEDDEYGGKGYAQRTKGYNPFLKIKKESKGKKGVFSRGSLRVRKPKRMAV
jgi:hypothetical protein